MSGRQVFQYVLTGLLAVVTAIPGQAQFTGSPDIIFTGSPDSHQVVPLGSSHELFILPIPWDLKKNQCRVVPCPPFCAFDCEQNQGTQISPASGSVNLDAGLSGNAIINERKFDFLNQVDYSVLSLSCDDVQQFFVPGHKIDHSYPILGVTTLHWDETGGGWWVEKVRMPLPREGTPQYTFTSGQFEPQVPPSNECHSCCNMPVPAPCCSKGSSLAGTWVRELESAVIAVTVVGDELKIGLTQKVEGTTQTATLTADYTLSKDGLVHGVITGVNFDEKRDSHAIQLPNNAANHAHHFGMKLVDCPFSFRTRMTSIGLMVSNLKVATPPEIGADPNEMLAAICGMYKLSKDGTVPLPKEQGFHLTPRPYPYQADVLASGTTPYVPTIGVVGGNAVIPTVPNTVLPTLPPPRECPGVGTVESSTTPDKKQIFQFSLGVFGGAADSSSSAQVIVPPSPPIRFDPAAPANVPPQTFDTIVNVLGQMMNGNQSPAVAVVPAQPVPCPVQPGCAAPYMGLVLPPCAAAMPLPKVGPVGTWVRVVGPMVYVIQIAPDHMTITATSAEEDENGKVLTAGCILTADYHTMRDGTTLVGLITSLDARIDGDLTAPVDFGGFAEELSQLQKAVTDQPFAMSVRVYGDALVIGNVRLPEVESESWDPMTVLGGRYTAAGDKPLPKPKVAKALMPIMPVCVPVLDAPCLMPPSPPVRGPILPTGIMGAPTAIPILPPPVVRPNSRSLGVPDLPVENRGPDWVLNRRSADPLVSGPMVPASGQSSSCIVPYRPASETRVPQPSYILPASLLPTVLEAPTPAYGMPQPQIAMPEQVDSPATAKKGKKKQPIPEMDKKPSAQAIPARIEPSR